MLPKIKYPIYKTKMPSTGRIIKFRPFLVKEEKLLLMAASGKDENEIKSAIMQVVNNCILDEMDVEKMPVFDLEWLFLQLRIKSVSSVVETIISGDENSDCEICQKDTKVLLNLEDVRCELDESHTNKIELTDTIGLVMKYPTSKTFESFDSDDVDQMFDYIINCIDFIYDDKKQYNMSDSSREEAINFLESLNREQFTKIDNFFSTMPECKLYVTNKCNKCGHEIQYELKGLSDFLA